MSHLKGEDDCACLDCKLEGDVRPDEGPHATGAAAPLHCPVCRVARHRDACLNRVRRAAHDADPH
eukprot:879529-Prymnesium_polylepis.1